MIQRPAALSIALAFAASSALFGCDNTARLTEQEHIQRAKDFEDQGKLNGSIIELKNAIQKNPDSPQARLLLGQVYLKTGAGAAAEKELSRAEKLGVSRESIKPQLGEALLLMGEYKRVLDEILPGDQTSRFNLARIYQIRAEAMLRQGQTKEACTLFQQSLDTDKSHPPTYWGLANCAVVDQDVPKARAWLNDALKLGTQQAQTWVGMGNLEQFNKTHQAALVAYSNALKVEPNNLEALQSRAALNLGLGNLDAAQADIDKTSRLAPQSLGAFYLSALLHFEQKKYAEARSDLDKIFKLTPDHLPSVLLAGATAHALGSYQQAESLLNRFLARFPHHAYARRVLASTQIKQNQPDRALETLAPLIGADSKDVAALVMASDAYVLKGEPSKTASYLERAAALDPKNAYVQTQLGLSHLSTGDNQLAIAELGNAAALDSNQYRADYALVLAHLSRKEFDKALTAIDALEKKLKGSPLPYTMRGSALLGKNDSPGARRSFEKALSINPAFYPAAASLAQLDLRDKQPDAARKRFERLLEKDKNNLQAMLALAQIAAQNNEEAELVKWLEKAAAAHPNAIGPRAALARHYLTRNEYRKALAIANETLNANPDNPAALDLLGSVQLANNDKTSAASTFTRLTQKTDQSPDSLLRLATAQMSAGKSREARATLQRVLKLDPAHPGSLDALIKLDMKDNLPQKALQLARQTQQRLPGNPLGFEREGDILLFQKQPALAAVAYEKALATNQTDSALFIKLHRALSLAGNAKRADPLLAARLKSAPEDLAVHVYAADSLIARGRDKEAVDLYQQLQQRVPRDPTILNNLATLYQRTGHPLAVTTAEQALKLAPDNPAIQDTLGWILVERGQASRGLKLIGQALSSLPQNADVRYHHAAALAKTGNTAQARKELERLLRDTPTFKEAEAAKALLKGM
ncbi:MAG: PEP-CTERM system TPR-repeat protein PrsT [Thiobacillus sp.]|nr:PEP-CTERM system TPR-repeat protein PrsT [Thiobacillus sp.]